MSSEILNEAEFLLRIVEERSLPKLKRLLDGAGIERALPILRRINDLLEGNNAEVLLHQQMGSNLNFDCAEKLVGWRLGANRKQ